MLEKSIRRAIDKFIEEHYVAVPTKPIVTTSEADFAEYSLYKNIMIPTQGETFSEMLLRLINKKGLKASHVYKRAMIDRRMFSRIKNEKDYAPSKKTALAFAIAMELSLDETKDLLLRAGYALSTGVMFDVVVMACIKERVFNIVEIDVILYENGCTTFARDI